MIWCAFYNFVYLKFILITNNHIFHIKLNLPTKIVAINLIAKNVISYFYINYYISNKILSQMLYLTFL